MYCDKENVNELTALLVAYGVKYAVVAPGSRNAPIVHNLSENPDIVCCGVTDERSAGFYALGIAQEREEPVVVCVTSGSALLNVMPAVAEAFYQHLPLVVIAADRPMAWIDQQVGQTIPQPDSLGRFVAKAVNLPEPHNDEERWYCNRLINEALIACVRDGGTPVLINVPISRPLMNMNVAQLPKARKIEYVAKRDSCGELSSIKRWLESAQRPMIVIGQLARGEAERIRDYLKTLSPWFAFIYECIGNPTDDRPYNIDKAIQMMGDKAAEYMPDAIIYVGGTLVSNNAKRFLQNSDGAKTCIVNSRGDVYDTFQNLAFVVESSVAGFFEKLWQTIDDKAVAYPLEEWKSYARKWHNLLETSRSISLVTKDSKSLERQAVEKYVEAIEQSHTHGGYRLQSANSMSVRLINDVAHGYVYCNRGVNGIEGSISTAAGMSVATRDDVYCVTGDLSFFYDSNALRNAMLKGNLHVLLLNNNHGAIFDGLQGMCNENEASKALISGSHSLNAEALCQSLGAEYQRAENIDDLTNCLDWAVSSEGSRPKVLEYIVNR
ncbi:MAG: 2-succinyl-5-enolpyruvyl-6-hydroxy-3-cyclohexene-1-carboxylic-acid synthase [Prevotella sp.]|nr:2-succinyl-5-enolpyruvyl-6-hydroxy-3-cyclohexene-1-carboxylic-acid synthase [Prevotella sp.]